MFEKDLSKIEAQEPKATFDASKYAGRKVKIAKVTQVEKDSYYDKDGGKIDTPRKIPAIKIETEKLDDLPSDDGTTKPLIVSTTLNLKEIFDEDGKVIDVTISKHTKGKLWKFMRTVGATTIPEMVGKEVVINVEPSADESDDRMWLRI